MISSGEKGAQLKAARVVVRGLVQGVGFRYWSAAEAGGLGVVGYVRNQSDGSVEAWLEGGEDAVERMIRRLRQGPPGAEVMDVQVQFETPKGEFRNFIVRR